MAVNIPRTLSICRAYSPPYPKANAAVLPIFSTIRTVASAFPVHRYGPSLRKESASFGIQIPRDSSGEISKSLNEDDFTRVFDISALRVPADVCSTLENRLRGHLLNWPRIKNIARVPGDEIDEKLRAMLPDSSGGDDEQLNSLNRRIYGRAEGDGEPLNAVLYRDRLATTFNSVGFVNFKNLAAISRPKKRKKATKCGDGEKSSGPGAGRNGGMLVEVIEDEIMKADTEALSRLLGDGVVKLNPKWRGSTRLLLLDQRYANKNLEEMPEAVKAVFREYDEPVLELVRCRMSLFYDYWQLGEILEALLPEGMIIPTTYEIVGHIAHLNLRDDLLQYKALIAKLVLDKTKPKIQTVVNKVDAIQNDFRTMQLEVLAGNNSLVTTVVESGLRFNVDLAAVYVKYWNSRLGTERQRLLGCFSSSDVVCDVFAGVGPIALSAAKIVKYVYANDLNPRAVEYLERNCVVNKLERKIRVFNMDGRRFIETVFPLAAERSRPITQVVMDLPNDAAEFLDAFRGLFGRNFSPGTTLPRIHVYGFSRAEDPEFDFLQRIKAGLSEDDVKGGVEMHRVRAVAPGKWMLCASFELPERVASE
ncbi:hypothetical protein M569_10664, partial [Genlisea aurea]